MSTLESSEPRHPTNDDEGIVENQESIVSPEETTTVESEMGPSELKEETIDTRNILQAHWNKKKSLIGNLDTASSSPNTPEEISKTLTTEPVEKDGARALDSAPESDDSDTSLELSLSRYFVKPNIPEFLVDTNDHFRPQVDLFTTPLDLQLDYELHDFPRESWDMSEECSSFRMGVISDEEEKEKREKTPPPPPVLTKEDEKISKREQVIHIDCNIRMQSRPYDLEQLPLNNASGLEQLSPLFQSLNQRDILASVRMLGGEIMTSIILSLILVRYIYSIVSSLSFS